MRIELYGCGHYRAGQRPAASLVQADDRTVPGCKPGIQTIGG